MSHVSDLEHRRLDATVYPDCVVEVHRISDVSRSLRKAAVTKIWRIDRILGRGTYGEVELQIQDRDEDSKRAVKVIRTRGRVSSSDCSRELEALMEFTKPKYKDEGAFVEFLGWFQTDNAIHITMEYIPLGDLEQNLQQLEQSSQSSGPLSCVLKDGEVRDITSQILEGVNIMHAEGFAHRDLKPQNVLVVQTNPKWWVKLGDFGLSKRTTECTVLRSQAGTQAFMAPEMFHYVPGLNPQSSEYTNAVDIWAIGCITYRILAGNPPFSDLWSLKTYCGDPKIPMPSKSGSLARAESFLGGLLMPHPDDRLTASRALQDPWLTSHLPDSSELVHDDYPPTHLTPLYTHFKYDSSGSKTVKLAVENSATQFHYNTGSHAGLRSYNEPSATPKGVPKPTEWPQADVQRMPEPMPHAFDLDKVGALALAEDIKPRATKRSEPRYDLSSEENEEKMANKPRINGKKYDDTNQRRYTGSSEEEVFVEENDDEFGDPPPPYRQTGLKSPDLNKQPKGKSRVSEDAISYSIENLSAQREPQPLLWLRKKLFNRSERPEARATPSSPKFYIVIHTFTGYRLTMQVLPHDKISHIKKMLRETKDSPVEGLDSKQVRLNFEGKLLENHMTLSGLGIEEGSRIDLRWVGP